MTTLDPRGNLVTSVYTIDFFVVFAEVELTTWEEYNYILFGLTNELIDLGAKDELRMTVLQLWTSYLRKTDVAFTSTREPKIPKLGPCYSNK